MQWAAKIRHHAAADDKNTILWNSNAAEPIGASIFTARHDGDGMPGEVGEVEHMPLYLFREPIESEDKHPSTAEAHQLPFSEEAVLSS